jgi:hypothetical protein
MKKISEHLWMTTEATPIQIGKPASPPTTEALAAIRSALQGTGASIVYWFWVSISGDRPHLGLAVAPNEEAIVSAVFRAVEPIWAAHSPWNTYFDILPLGQAAGFDRLVLEDGELLYGSATDSERHQLLRTTLIRSAVPTAVVVILAQQLDPNSNILTLQDYHRDGRSFIPIFRSMESFQRSTRGGVDKPIYQIDRRLFVSMLSGAEMVILDLGLPDEIVTSGDELKRVFPEPFDYITADTKQ